MRRGSDVWVCVLAMGRVGLDVFRGVVEMDLEEMEQLGIIECDPEDFALCSFACPSKIELSEVIQDGLDLIEADG